MKDEVGGSSSCCGAAVGFGGQAEGTVSLYAIFANTRRIFDLYLYDTQPTTMRATRRDSTICIPHCIQGATVSDIDNVSHSAAKHCDICFDEDECKVTDDRLALVRNTAFASSVDRCTLSDKERSTLQREQNVIRETLFSGPSPSVSASSIADMMREAAIDEERRMSEESIVGELPQDRSAFGDEKLTDLGFQLKMSKIRARLDSDNDGVLGVLEERPRNRFCSMKELVPRKRSNQTSVSEVNLEDVSYVRKPDMKKIVEEYDQLTNHPKYTLRQVVLSRRFQLYIHRFANAQFSRTLLHPTLPQPKDLNVDVPPYMICQECTQVTEKKRTRKSGHRFIVAADTQFGILMDGFAMEKPSWRQEIEISRRCVERINDMKGAERPLFVIVCGDLVDTESSFSGAIASWKKIMAGWERSLIFDQQVRWVRSAESCLPPCRKLIESSTVFFVQGFQARVGRPCAGHRPGLSVRQPRRGKQTHSSVNISLDPEFW